MPKKSMSEAIQSKEQQGLKESTENSGDGASVETVRGAELGQKMAESREQGEAYRAAHQGTDVRKPAGSSNTEKSHKAD